jgi:shikimate kinase
MATVVLTGFMATGKTSVGERLATRLGKPFVDTDALVERSEGRSIESIFATEGESYFRTAERRAIVEALGVPGAVIATGGGAIVDAANLATLKAAAPIVCLTASPEVLEKRVRAAQDRPLLKGDEPRRRIERLMAERAPAYAKADLTVDTSDRSVDEVVEEIARYLQHGAGSATRRPE